MRLPLRVIAVATVFTALATGCGAQDTTAQPGAQPSPPTTGLRMMVPNSPGSGYDTTMRAAVAVMEQADLVTDPKIENVSGAGGTVGLGRLVSEKGNGDLIMMMGLGVVGATYTNKAPAKLSEATPIARLIEEEGAVVVRRDSPFKTLDDLLAAWKADPQKVRVGGGSSPGGPDHLLPMQLASAVGIAPKKVSFVSYDGGGELLTAILDGEISFATSGTGEFAERIASGELRLLATTGDQPLKSFPDVKTLKDQGVDLVFTNWRGVVAPSDITPEQKARWVRLFDQMHASEHWEAALAENGWTDAYLSGDPYAAFLTEQTIRVDQTLTQLGLA